MAATFHCQACNFQRAMPEKDLGKRGRCPKCGATAQVVADAAAELAPATPAVSATPSAPATPQAKPRRDQTVMGEPLHQEAIQAAPRHVHSTADAQQALRLPPPLPAATGSGPAPRSDSRRESRYADDEWYYSYDDERVGPMSETELQARIDKGEVRRSDGVWKKGMSDWRRADEVFEFYEERRRGRRRRRSREDQGNGGLVCGILACIFGGVAFIFCPILMGLTGIVLGIVSISISENKTIGIVGLAVSAVGMVVGMILGFLVFSAIGFGRF